ncbi:hypothetical protein ACT3SP_05705 [Brachybacterium sp. AOP43-C2-M15]|uniref:hypothetical protein n=1 Tax=Brachybacterium sp. AOP43-C2-M15 TaxID=3457661 RepID=UPI0040348774
MNTFIGCEPEALEDLAERMREGARRLLELIERLRAACAAVTWNGPDADAHRRRSEEAAADGLRVVAALRGGASELQLHARQQELASRAETDAQIGSADPARSLRAELPWRSTADGEGDELGVNLPRLRGRRVLEDPGRWVGGPFMAEDPQDLLPGLPDAPSLPGGVGPWIAGPMMPPGMPAKVSGSRPLPEGEDFALDPTTLADAQKDRRIALGSLPLAGQAQMAMGLHDALGRGLDRVEETLEESGLGGLSPVVSAVRIPHTLAAPVLGEKSVLGQVTDGIDRGLANVMQTGEEISGAIGDGDWAAAVRAGERGMFRHADTAADVLTATPVPAVMESTSDLIGFGAEAVEMAGPEAAAPLRGVEQTTRDVGERWQSAQDQLTDGEGWYDRRRQYLPMPWDPQG